VFVCSIIFVICSSFAHGFGPTEKITSGDFTVWFEENGLQVSCREYSFIVGSYIRLFGPAYDSSKELYYSFDSKRNAKVSRTKDGGTIEFHEESRGASILYRIKLTEQKIHVLLDCRVRPDVELGGIEYTGAFIPRSIVLNSGYFGLAGKQQIEGRINAKTMLGDLPVNCNQIRVMTLLGEMAFNEKGGSSLTLGDNRKNRFFTERDRHIWLTPALAFDSDRRIHHEMEIMIEPKKELSPISKLPVVECPSSLPKQTIVGVDPPITLLPVPQQMERDNGAWVGKPCVLITAEGDAASAIERVGKILQQDMKDEWSLECPVQKIAGNKAIGIVLQLTQEGVPPYEDAYSLNSTGRNIVITAREERGLFYGIQTLMQLLQPEGNNIRVSKVRIQDWPMIKIRAVHPPRLWPSSSLDQFKQYFKLISRYKYNMIILENSGSIHFSDLPWAWDRSGGFSPESVNKLVMYGKSRYLEMVPQLQCLGHASEWLGRNPDDLEKYPWLKDCFENDKTRWDLCISNPKTREILFKTIDRVSEVFDHPKYFHLGLDESGGTMKCPRCSQFNRAELFAEYIQSLYQHLKKNGQAAMIWHDMILDKSEGGYGYALSGIRNKLPRDIIICDWEYDALENFKAKIFKREGFQVVGCPWNTPQNIYAWAQLAAKAKIGFMSTNWIFFSRDVPFNVVAKYRGRDDDILGTLLGGIYAWNPSQPVQANLSATDLIQLYGMIPVSRHHTSFKTYDIRPIANQPFALGGFNRPEKHEGCAIVSGIPFNISCEKDSQQKGTSIPSIKARDINNFPIDDMLDSLYLLAAISEPIGENVRMNVNIIYVNGKTASVAICGNQSVSMLNNPQMMTYMGIPLSEPCGWVGLIRKDRGVAVQSISVVHIKNPYPDLCIKSISIVSEKNQPAGIMILGVTGNATSSIQ
jgi:hypothetical protein